LAAIEKKDAAGVNALLAAGADPNTEDEHDNSALVRAAETGSVEICEALLKRGAKVDGGEKFLTPLLMAISEKQAAVAKLLLDHGAKADVSAGFFGGTA